MTAWRVGVAIRPETVFGDGGAGNWRYIGVGMDFNFTEQNNWKFQNGMGSKVPELEFEGRFSGTWNGNLYLDYNNFYWIQFALEGYAYGTATYPTDSEESGREVGIHIFTTANNKALKSFALRFIKLDRPVGGYDANLKADEEIILKGCVMNKFSPSYEGSSTSAVKCSIGGVFVDTQLTCKEETDTIDGMTGKNNVRAINWGCLKVMNEDNSGWEKIANNERTGFTFSRSTSTIPDCGQRIDTAFYESAIQPITITSLVYSRNPNQWQTRMHTGGARNDLNLTTNTTSSPKEKGLEPIPNIRIESGTPNDSGRTADYLCIAEFEDCVVDSWGNSYNSQSEITENPTLKAMKGQIMFATPDVKTSMVAGVAGTDYNTIVKVTYDFDNGDTADLVAFYPKDTIIKLLDYKGTKTDNDFKGWSVSGGSVLAPGTSQKITADTTFTASWQSTA